MAIHFQKYPEHKNEELLRHLLIRSKKRGLVEDNLNDASGRRIIYREECTNENRLLLLNGSKFLHSTLSLSFKPNSFLRGSITKY